ncbi:MAG: ribonuclease HI [Methanotrichaceae archaeon]|nr:ribonuclease HI [Methanotrichaceae archaeon]
MITIYFDGLCYPKNPCGVAAYGYLIYRDGELIHRGFRAVGEGKGMTSNVAEYEGLKAAVQWLSDHGIKDDITINGDSQLVIKQMKGEWEVRSKTSRKYVPEIRRLLEGRDVRFVWVPREMNEEADRLSRKAYEAYQKRKRERLNHGMDL